MSYKFDFGDGRLNDCEITSGVCTDLNSYARAVSISQNVVTIENETDSNFCKIAAGETVLLHISATNGTDAEPLGKYIFAQVLLRSGDTLTLDKTFDVDLNYFYVQVVSVPQFKNLTLTDTKIAPPAYDIFKFTGGVVAFQVFDNFTMTNSQIDLTQAGIPTQKKLTYRPLSNQEYGGETDGSKLAGQENFITSTNLMLNAGDGAAIIQAYNFTADEKSRIGNPATHGQKLCRGAADTKYKPADTINIGGSTILIAAKTFNAPPQVLAKYRDINLAAGRGLCRCYIASDTILDDDEKLYSYDRLEDLGGVQNFGVEDFGAGTAIITNPAFQINNVAQVTAVVGKEIYLGEKTLAGYAKIKTGSLILQRNAAGEFQVSRVLNLTNKGLTVEKVLRDVTEVIAVGEFGELEIGSYSGEIFAVAVSGMFSLTGDLTAERELNCGNSQSFNKFGGIFILAKKIIFGENAKLNAGAMLISESIEGFTRSVFTGKPNFVWLKS